jgi:hypothetical protein
VVFFFKLLAVVFRAVVFRAVVLLAAVFRAVVLLAVVLLVFADRCRLPARRERLIDTFPLSVFMAE